MIIHLLCGRERGGQKMVFQNRKCFNIMYTHIFHATPLQTNERIEKSHYIYPLLPPLKKSY